MLRNYVSPKVVAEYARVRKTDFEVTRPVEKELRTAGADDALLLVLREVAPKPPAPAGLGEGDLILKLATTEDAWISVAADGNILMRRLLPPNSVRVFRAKDAFDVTTGNAEGTLLTPNGKTHKPLGGRGEFKNVHLARSGF